MGCFCIKLSYEDKVNLYNDKIKGIAIKSLGPKYGITYHNAQYLIRLIDKHGFDILRTTKNKTYSSFEKERIIIVSGVNVCILGEKEKG